MSNRTRAGWLAGGLLAALVAVAAAQEPKPFPLLPATGEPPLAGGAMPKLKLPPDDPPPAADPGVEPAQFTTRQPRPDSVPSSPPAAVPNTRPVADPPSAVVRIQVRVPADVPPGDDVKYVITVRNNSTADAHKVTVRNPIPAAATPVKAAPEWSKEKTTEKALVWEFGTLKPNETKAIELTLKPKPDAGEVRNHAYVSFEHGEAVVTRINKPAVKVTKQAPTQTVRDEPFTVRVTVENSGRVPAERVRLTENLTASAEVEAITAGVKKPKGDGNQWEWDVGSLQPGQRRVIEYRVTPRQGGDALATSHLSADKGVLEKAEARTRVLVPGLAVKLAGPAGLVPAGDPARYEVTVRNTGSLASSSVRVAGTVPGDCRLTQKTEGGQVFRDQIVWVVPRLEPGEAVSFRYALRASTTGPRTVRASASDARGTKSADELATTFQGTAALVWETVPDPVSLAVGKQGLFTVRVRNNGGEAARNVRVELTLPPEVGLVKTTPEVRPAQGPVVFPAETIAAGGQATYTLTFSGRQAGQAWFKVQMTADVLGDRPMETEKMVEVLGGVR